MVSGYRHVQQHLRKGLLVAPRHFSRKAGLPREDEKRDTFIREGLAGILAWDGCSTASTNWP